MLIKGNSYNDLIEWLKCDDIDVKTMQYVTCKFLKVIPLFVRDITKDELRNLVNNYVSKFSDQFEKPIFLMQEDIDFKIQDIYKGGN